VVAVTIGDKKIPALGHCDRAWFAEVVAVVSVLPPRAQHEQRLAIATSRREFENLVQGHIGQENISVSIDCDSVRHVKPTELIF